MCVKMEKPSAEELLQRILELENRHAHIKQEISKFTGIRPKHDHHSHHRLLPMEPLAMKLTEKQYLNILQSMDQAIFIYDFNHLIVFWNRGAEKIYGYTPGEVIGRSPTELLAEPKDAAASEIILERTVKGESWSGEFPIRNKKGESFVVICANTPYRDENSRLRGAMCLSSDSRPYQVMKVGLTVSAPTRTGRATSGVDPQQHFQTSFASKISNLASKVKLKMKKGENYIDHEGSNTSGQSETSTPRGHLSPSPFGVFFSTGIEEHFPQKLTINSFDDNENKRGVRKILSSKAEELIDKTKMVWNRFNVNQEHEPYAKLDCQLSTNNNSGSNKIEASGLWLSTLHVSRTSSTSSTSSGMSIKSNVIIKAEREIGTEIADYEISWEDLIIREQIGEGSCGIVYHALWYGSDIAVKRFAYQEYSDDVIVSFKQEVSLMKRLRHPNILLFMGAVVSPQHLCIVTEFLPRGSLFRILQRNTTRLNWKRRVHMAIDIARGMNYLHSCNPPIVHRDLKSSNLLVDKNWTVKVGDFGLSRIKHQTYLNTKTGKGTPQWMAPEILRNGQADEKSDVYSYGVVLWEITTEKIPWEHLHPMQVIGAVGFMNQTLEIPKDVDPQWASLVESCLCSEPQSRPTFEEILYKLKDLQKKFAAERRR